MQRFADQLPRFSSPDGRHRRGYQRRRLSMRPQRPQLPLRRKSAKSRSPRMRQSREHPPPRTADERCRMISTEMIHAVGPAQEITSAAVELREIVRTEEITPNTVLEIFERWAAALNTRELQEVPGVTFLRLWLRKGTLEPIVVRELGPHGLEGGWWEDGRARLRAFPLGLIGHWPAA